MRLTSFLLVLAVALFFAGCQNRNKAETDLEKEQLNDSRSVTGLTGSAAKLVKTASIQVKVKNVEQGSRNVSALAKKHGGMVYYQHFESVEGERKELAFSADSLLVIATFTPQANITVRVPSQNLETFLFEAADMGYYTASAQLQIDDKSLSYLENTLKQKNRGQALSNGNKQSDDTGSALKTIQVRDEAIEQLIANKAIDADVAYSMVSLSLTQNAIVRKEMIANYVLAGYDLSSGQRLSHAMQAGWEAFLNFLIAVSHLWMFLLLALILYVAYRFFQQRKRLSI